MAQQSASGNILKAAASFIWRIIRALFYSPYFLLTVLDA
jgi:hypothetical protein